MKEQFIVYVSNRSYFFTEWNEANLFARFWDAFGPYLSADEFDTLEPESEKFDWS